MVKVECECLDAEGNYAVMAKIFDTMTNPKRPLKIRG